MLIAERFEILERVGGGGMGEVFRATDQRLGRDVAVKRLWPHLSGNADLVRRAEQEGQILARLRHPGIIDVFDALDAPDGGKYLILRYIDGPSLATEMSSSGPMSWDRCAGIGFQVCSALDAAHRAGVIHRDIKPANVLIASDGSVHVADFGIARLTNVSGANATATGQAIGTPDYFAPEQARGAEVTPACDLYSLGCVMFEALCGRPPYVAAPDSPPIAVSIMHLSNPVADPAEYVPGLPPVARELLMRCMAKDPGDRFPSAADLGQALVDSVGISGGATVLPASFGTSVRPTPTPGVTAAPAIVEQVGETVTPPFDVSAPGAAVVEDGPGERSEVVETPAPAPEAPHPVPGVPEPEGAPVPDGAASGDDDAAAGTPDDRRSAATHLPGDPPAAGAAQRQALTHVVHSARSAATVVRSADEVPAERPGIDRRKLAVAAVIAALVAASGGTVLGIVLAPSHDAPEPVEVAVRNARVGPLVAAVPRDWAAEAGGGRLTDAMSLRTAASFAPGADTAQAGGPPVVVGMSTATGPSLLSPRFSKARGQAVEMGGLTGLRYDDLNIGGGTRATVFTAPTDRGAATVVCPQGNDGKPAEACAGIAGGLRMAAGRALPLEPTKGNARAVRASLNRAATAMKSASRIDSAGSAGAQASAAASVASTLASAARALPTSGAVSPRQRPAINELRASLKAAAAAYRSLADAAQAVSSSRWAAARGRVSTASGRVRAAQAGLRDVGFTLK